MPPHHRHLRSQFTSSYATVRPQRRRELKLLPLPDYSSCFTTPQTSCYHSGHLRLVSRALSAIVGRHSYPTSSHGGCDDNAIVGTKERTRGPRKMNKTASKQGVCAPSLSSSELSTRMVQSGDPLGRKELGQHVVRWLKQGMHLMASEFASSDQPETQGNALLWSDDGHVGFVTQAQAHLSATPMPKGQEALCCKASAHYPTLFDNFQRELRGVLLRRQEEGLVNDWRSTRSWALLKEMAKSAEHRTAARRSTAPVLHSTLGISLDKTRLVQDKIDGFVQKMTGLLRLERDAELELTPTTQDHELSSGSMMDGKPKKPVVAHGQAQEEGDTICNLRVISSSTGLTGQHLVLFRVEGSHRLPPTRLSPGDMVCVRACDSQGEVATATSCVQGSVHNLGEDGRSITVAFRSRRGDPAFSKFPGKFARIDRVQALADAVTYERNCEALMVLQKRGLQKRNASIGVVATLFGDKEDATKLEKNNLTDCCGPEAPDDGLLETHSHSFDTSQSRALALALDKERPVLVIQGPPGTGKTRLLSHLVACVVRRGERVLVTAPSNAAVDNMVDSLSGSGLNIVRVGNPSRISPSVTPMSLGEIVAKRLEKLTREFETKRSALRKDLKRRVQDDNGSSASGVRQRLKRLGKDYKEEEEEAVREVLSNAAVVLSTNTGAADPLIRGTGCFDLVIIDEAGQAIEPSCWIPMLQGKRCILAGDHRQLAPVVLSREAMKGGLGMSLLERASSLHDGLLATTLTTQYRMHESIASWASKEMYGGLLRSFPSVASRLLVDYPSVKVTWMTQCALLLLDTRKAYGSLNIDCEESLDPAGTSSFYNNGEADIVAHHVLNLVQCGVPPTSIVVQSPYIAQVQLLRGRLQEYPMAFDVEVSTIDSFQGREADAVVISMVRSNSMGEVGFLADRRRMNVAITRARSHVAVVCDTSTICNNAFLARLLLHIRQHGQVRHVDPSSLDGGFHLQVLPSLG